MQLTRSAGFLIMLLVTTTSMVVEANDDRPTLALILSEFEYKSDTTVPPFAEKHFADDFHIVSAVNADEHSHDLPEIDVLVEADVAIFSIWRRALPPEQLAVIKQYLASGKPLVALRTCSHAFQTRDGTTPEGRATWPTFDRDILGGYYQGHHGNYAHKGGPKTHVWTVTGAEDHPLLTGIEAGEFVVPSWLYKMQPLDERKAIEIERLGPCLRRFVADRRRTGRLLRHHNLSHVPEGRPESCAET